MIEDFPKPKLSSLAKYLTNGIVQYEGEKWAKHRKIINPAFHIEKLKVRLFFFNVAFEFSSSYNPMIYCIL